MSNPIFCQDKKVNFKMSSTAILKCCLCNFTQHTQHLRFRITFTIKALSILNLKSLFFSEKRLDISCDSTAWQAIHIKCHVLVTDQFGEAQEK